MRFLCVNARIIDPESMVDYVGWLSVEGGLISNFGAGDMVGSSDFSDVVDCGGHLLIPGIVDIHVHLRDPGMNSAEDIVSGSISAAAGGVTTVVCQPNTTPAIDSPLVVEYIKNAAKNVGINIKMYGAATVGRLGEVLVDVPSMLKAGVCGFTDDGDPIRNARLMLQLLNFSREFNFPVAQHAEDHELSRRAPVNEGPVAFMLGEKGWPSVAESSVVARDLDILRSCNGAHYHVLHVSSGATLDHIKKAKNDGMKVTCEVTPHHFSIIEDDLLNHSTNSKMNPPLRCKKERQKIIEGIRSGVIDCIATDHAPHHHASKEKSLSCSSFGVIGLETLVPLSLELYHNGHIPLIEVIRLLTLNPAKIINDTCAGRIKKGGRADFTLIDIDSEVVISDNFASKSRNSPFVNRRTKGKVLLTVCRGKVVYRL